MLDVIVPVFNESSNIKNLFDKLAENVKTPMCVNVIYDFDEDNTLPVIKRIMYCYKYEIRTIKNKYQKGALNAIKTGFECCDNNAILVTMADLSDSLDIVDEMYHLINDGFELVCGSRYMKGGKQLGGPLLKGLFSRLAGISLHILTRIPTHDVTNSFKMYSRKVIDKFQVESTGGFELGMELTVKAYSNGMRITELPSTWHDRTGGQSRFRLWRWLPRYLYWYFFAIWKTWTSIFNRKVYVSDFQTDEGEYIKVKK